MVGQGNNNHNEDGNPLVKLLKLIALIVGIISAIVTIVATTIVIYRNMEEGKKPIVSVENQLQLPIIVTINNAYFKRILPGETKSITLLSTTEFPAKVNWKVERYKNNLGEPIGEEISEEIRLVDKGTILVVDNEIGITTYFYPIIINNTDSKCNIIINDGLEIEYLAGVSSPHKVANMIGYYKYASNSNVTLECSDNIYWRGKRNGISGPPMTTGVGDGVIEIPIP